MTQVQHERACRRGRDRLRRLHRRRELGHQIRYAAAIGCVTADGTYLAHGPDTNLPRLLAWCRRLEREATLW